MRRYNHAMLAGVTHLGIPNYDDDEGTWLPPDETLCGLVPDTWSKTFVRAAAWSKRRRGTVCAECDRTALWESIISLNIK